MTAKKQSTEVAIPPVEGVLIRELNVDKATGVITTAQQSGIGELEQSYLALTKDATPEALALMAATIEGNAAMKGFLKQCSTLRSAIDRAHKEAKGPFLDATRALDAKLKEMKLPIEEREAVVKQAIKTFEDSEAAEAAAKQRELEARLAEAEAELAKYKQVTEEAGVTHPFIDRSVVVTVRGKPAYEAAVSLFGDAYDEVKTDENGVNYVLEVVLRRKEIQEV